MAAETLLREIEEKRSRTMAQLEAEYKEKRAEVSKRAREQIAYLTEASKKNSAASSERERARMLGAASLQAKKLLFDATEKMIEENMEGLRAALSAYAGSEAYTALVPRLLSYAKRRLGGDISVRCRASDAAAVRREGVKVLASDLHSIGGFKAESSDGTLELDLTFEELLRSREDGVRAAILGKS